METVADSERRRSGIETAFFWLQKKWGGILFKIPPGSLFTLIRHFLSETPPSPQGKAFLRNGQDCSLQNNRASKEKWKPLPTPSGDGRESKPLSFGYKRNGVVSYIKSLRVLCLPSSVISLRKRHLHPRGRLNLNPSGLLVCPHPSFPCGNATFPPGEGLIGIYPSPAVTPSRME